MKQNQNSQIIHIISAGTQVVTRFDIQEPHGGSVHPGGAVGIVIKSPADSSHSYRIRFADGYETSLKREQISIRKEVLREGLSKDSLLREYNLFEHVIYKCIIGSRAYGLDNEDSDTDRRGIYLPPADLHWSLFSVPEQLENQESQECYWELQKFINLALKANPNVLECLYTPLVEEASPLAEELLEMRDAFVSKLAFQTYNGYVMSQFKKLQADLRNHGKIKWKHAMHLIRLLLSGIDLIKEGRLTVRVKAHREDLLAIRQGKMTWEEI